MRIGISCLILLSATLLGCKPSNEPGVVEKVHSKVKETVNALEMHDLQLFISQIELAEGRMPSKDVIRDYAKKENPKLSKLLEDGTIVLTGAKSRDSVWAYEKDAPTKGGWVVTGSGESKMTAEELQKALGK